MEFNKLALLFTLLISTSAVQAKQVTICHSYLVGINVEMNCSGFKTKETFTSLYRRGWTYTGNVSGTSKFVLIFEK